MQVEGDCFTPRKELRRSPPKLPALGSYQDYVRCFTPKKVLRRSPPLVPLTVPNKDQDECFIPKKVLQRSPSQLVIPPSCNKENGDLTSPLHKTNKFLGVSLLISAFPENRVPMVRPLQSITLFH